MDLEPTETHIWDQKRILWLRENRLREIETAGWTILYQDPADSRFWELTYPNKEQHGDGPAQLSVISRIDAVSRYRIR
jgi:hypothetical protein